VRGGALFAFRACWPHSGMQSRRSAAEGVGRNRPGHRQQRKPRLSAELGTWPSFIGFQLVSPAPLARIEPLTHLLSCLIKQQLLLADNAYGSAAANPPSSFWPGISRRNHASLSTASSLPGHGIPSARAAASAWQLNTIRSTNERGEPLNHRSSEASQLIRPVLTCPALAKSKVTASRSL
jgi:hypothetical protein